MFDLSKIQYIRSSCNTAEQLVFCMKTQYNNLLKDITEIFPTFLHFFSHLENFSIADAKIALNDFKFCENQHNKAILYSGTYIHTFCIYCPIWVCIRGLHVRLQSMHLRIVTISAKRVILFVWS
jgi:hypothetical protein